MNGALSEFTALTPLYTINGKPASTNLAYILLFLLFQFPPTAHFDRCRISRILNPGV